MSGGNLDIPDAGGFTRTPAKVVADPAWRRREKPKGRWVFWLLGLVAISLVGSGVMLLSGTAPHEPADVPLITADPNPVRVRPDDPGGLRVPHLDKEVYDQIQRGTRQATAPRPGAPRVESLLPPPEAPKPLPVEPVALTPGPSPQQLARELEAPAPQPSAAAPQPPAAAPAPPPASPPPRGAAPPATPPAAASPSGQQAAVSPAAPSATPPTAAPPTGQGRIQVQLAAVPSEQAAAAEWERLRRRMPDLLGNQRLIVSRGERDGQPFFRVRTGGFADNAQARAFCDQVRQRGGSCFVAPAG
jgi:hypothetical protein